MGIPMRRRSARNFPLHPLKTWPFWRIFGFWVWGFLGPAFWTLLACLSKMFWNRLAKLSVNTEEWSVMDIHACLVTFSNHQAEESSHLGLWFTWLHVSSSWIGYFPHVFFFLAYGLRAAPPAPRAAPPGTRPPNPCWAIRTCIDPAGPSAAESNGLCPSWPRFVFFLPFFFFFPSFFFFFFIFYRFLWVLGFSTYEKGTGHNNKSWFMWFSICAVFQTAIIKSDEKDTVLAETVFVEIVVIFVMNPGPLFWQKQAQRLILTGNTNRFFQPTANLRHFGHDSYKSNRTGLLHNPQWIPRLRWLDALRRTSAEHGQSGSSAKVLGAKVLGVFAPALSWHCPLRFCRSPWQMASSADRWRDRAENKLRKPLCLRYLTLISEQQLFSGGRIKSNQVQDFRSRVSYPIHRNTDWIGLLDVAQPVHPRD